ncbi:MAG: LOW QUALITY PROTEIN: hypothetical protein BJ554DRAFT_5472 [Olpidium bornovanus]|uniref:Uncharacterized protein n=1 Tax=Olpidium bornovanus TaxID=278681 RepID=A0A8H8A075_9FUNG|nr:MAG: LOW QUALITY PROTEIN: hypothetical protein BJ554DRAFT_5472 [Olpidium bornovanus]
MTRMATAAVLRDSPMSPEPRLRPVAAAGRRRGRRPAGRGDGAAGAEIRSELRVPFRLAVLASRNSDDSIREQSETAWVMCRDVT